MHWAQKITFVLAVGMPYVNSRAALGSGLFIDHVPLEKAKKALASGDYNVLVIDPCCCAEEACELAQYGRSINPDLRVIWASRHAERPQVSDGESIVGANGHQVLRQLQMLLTQ